MQNRSYTISCIIVIKANMLFTLQCKHGIQDKTFKLIRLQQYFCFIKVVHF